MALHWTYNADFANTSAGYSTGSTIGVRDQIRFLIQDTRTARQLLYDEEIDWTQTQEANVFYMAALCCDTLVIRAGGQRQKRVGDLEIKYDLNFYRSLAVSLRARGSLHQVPYAGGVSIADMLAQEANTDRVPPRSTITEFDNPRARQPDANTGGDGTDFWPHG